MLPSPTAGQIQGLELQMVSPSPDQLGSAAQPVDVRQVIFNVTARDDSGAVVARDLDVQVYLSYGGVKAGGGSGCGASINDPPIDVVHLSSGQAMNHKVTLPRAFGATAIWLDEPVSHATGASPTIFFRNPFVADVQTPPDLMAPNAAYCTPFEDKFVTVDRAAGTGKLVVSAVFVDAFTVTDTGSSAFNSIYVYTFGRPPRSFQAGTVLSSFSGNISKFVGFTEVNFPLYNSSGDPANPALLPAPVVLKGTDTGNVPKLLGYSAAIVRNSGTICQMNPPNPNNNAMLQSTIDQWVKYNTFVLDNGTGACDSFTSFSVQVPQKVVGPYDPTMMVGKAATFTGMLRNSSGQNPVLDASGKTLTCDAQTACLTGTCVEGECRKNPYNFWTIVVRDQNDISTP
jgi:hypothetical protein